MDNFTSTMEQETNNNVSSRNDPYLEIELYLKKVTDEIGAVFDQWQKEAALKQCYPDVIKPDSNESVTDSPTLKVQEQLTPPSCSSPPAKIPPKVPPKRPNLLLPDLLQQQQQKDNTTSGNSPGNTPTSPLLQPKEVDSFLKKVQTTILGDNTSSDAGTQTPLSRSSSVAWLSSSQSSLGGGSAGADSSSPFSSSEETFLSSNGANGTAADTSSPERESCDSSSRNGSAGDLLENWDSSRPPVAGRDGIPSWRSATSDNETRVKRRPKAKPSEPLHSPTSVSSLTSSTMCPEMGIKSSSAPVLMKEPTDSSEQGQNAPNGDQNQRNYHQVRSHSERHLSEIEAAEACRWMRAAGFPQYAQMYADNQFPVDLHAVQKDHPFLDRDALQALFRRLHALNKCARLHRIDGGPAAAIAAQHNNAQRGGDTLAAADSDEEVECALSDNWMFLHQSRRWSRVSPLTEQQSPLHRTAPLAGAEAELPECDTEVSGADDLTDLTRIQNQLPLQRQHSSSLPPGKFKTTTSDMETEFASPQTFRRSGSEKLRDGAKAFLRRVESLKSRGKKAKVGCRSDEMPKIGAPQVIDVESMQERMKTLNCVDLNSPEALEAASPNPAVNPYTNANNNLLFPEKEDLGAHSDSECIDRSSAWMEIEEKNKESEDGKKKKKEPVKKARKLQTKEQRSATLNLDIKIKSNKPSSKYGKSDNGGLADISPEKEESRTSFYEHLRRSAFAKRHKELSKGSSEGSIHEEEAGPSPSKKTITRWHSFGRGSSAQRRPSTLPQLGGHKRRGVPLASLSCGQLMVLRQLAMLKLTAMMEKHSPSSRSTGFSWELPKFMRKTGKSNQPKDGALFGVSMFTFLQTTGQALPPAIQAAIQHLTQNALDRQGIFRRPGVKSRILKLRQHLSNLEAGEPLEFALEEQQDYDVADLVKQFFRDLPETLMTTKLSDTFVAIFQHVPLINRHEAMKWAVILLPDHHREVLQLLLSFLSLVASHSRQNQMTASNLSVCFAPSLFHSSTHAPSTPNTSIDSPVDSRGGSPRARGSKRAKQGSGSPDPKELSESRASHDCLLYLINHHDELVRVSQELLTQCHFSSMEQSVPLTLEELGSELGHDWRGYMHTCTSALLKELKERSRGWVSVNSQHPQVELSYKKVGDGHPLRVWKAYTEVEAPPGELLNRILREQFLWDPNLAKARVLARLDSHAEVFQYANYSMTPLAPRDFCVLRTWRSDLPKGGCVLVETSIEHGLSSEPLVPGSIRGIVLASRYLIEHCGSGRSKIIHLSRVDTKGRSVEWYNKCYGQMCALQLSRIRSSFTQYLSTDGPESKV